MSVAYSVETRNRELRDRFLTKAREVGAMAAADAEQIEREQTLPWNLKEALSEATFFKMLAPRTVGGAEADPETFCRVVEEVSRWDGSTGWCVLIGAVCSIGAWSLPPDVAWDVFGRDRLAYVAGSGVPSTGSSRASTIQASIVDGGYRVSGSWAFTSGCLEATWLMGIATVFDGTVPRLGPNGIPEAHWFLFPVRECTIHDDSWNTTGLRGSGSRDFTVKDVFVPNDYSWSSSFHRGSLTSAPIAIFGDGFASTDSSANYTTSPWRGVGPIGFAAVLLGIARGALDAFAQLAATKRPVGSKVLLRDDPLVHEKFGQAEAELRAARAFLYEAVRESWEEVQSIGSASARLRQVNNLAATHAAVRASDVVDTVWHLAGTSGIRVGSSLERRFRDVHTGRQNVGVSPANFGRAGEMFMKQVS